MRALLLLLFAVGTAGAQTIDEAIPPAIRISRASDVAVERGEVTWVSFALPQADAIAIDVPKGTLVVGFELRSADQVAWGHLEEATRARTRLGRGAGTLIEWDSASGDVEHLLLRHAARDCSATDVVRRCAEHVAIALLLPAIDRVLVEPKPARIDGKRATSALVKLTAQAPAEQPHLVEDLALVATTGDTTPALVFERQPRLQRSLDKQIIRRRFAIHEAQLRRCYSAVRQRKPDLAGTVMLHFLIAPDGSVSDLAADGPLDDPSVRTCLIDEVGTWDFPATDDSVRVNFPLTFRPSE
jgi:hypothetical protein